MLVFQTGAATRGTLAAAFQPAAWFWLALAVVCCGCGPKLASTSATTATSASRPAGTPAAEIVLVPAEGDSPARFIVRGLERGELAAFEKLDDERQARVFRVAVAGVASAPRLAGKCDVVDGAMRFTPRYPPEPGLRYLAVFDRGWLSPAGAKQPDAAAARIGDPRPAAWPGNPGHAHLSDGRHATGKRAEVLYLLLGADEPWRSISPRPLVSR